MATVTVQLFASYADVLGAPAVELPLTPGTTVQDLLYRIRSLPGASSLPPAPRVAVNRSFATSDQLIEASDEIALIPPVAGG
ncbi:MAG TPA: MoaD/ThiS family protein [Gemmatimonadaceae bacterium]|nr:MoaD/ThiS family protein [Gemmatimonadaceae bacterium]